MSAPYWNGRDLLVDGMTVATLEPAPKSALRLYIGGRSAGITVRPDKRWPDMWRVHRPHGS
jgi:hypothetical protein